MIWVVAQAERVKGDLTVPGDKSISHRATLLGALATGETRIANFLRSADCMATIRCLRALGITIEEDAEAEEGVGRLVVHGRGLRGLQAPQDMLDCGGSGTTMRLLAGILAGQSFASVLTGNEALRRRPMARIIEPLRRMGATISGVDGDRLPPLYVQGGALHGMAYHLPVASAQVKSAILLAALYAKGPTLLHEPAPSRDHTERMLKAMGISLDTAGTQIVLDPVPAADKPLPPLDIAVPGDLSSAAFFIVAACLLPDSFVRVRDVGVNPTRTGLLDVLRGMGAQIIIENERLVSGEPVADIVARSSRLRGVTIGGDLVPRMIDEFPILAVAATQAEGITHVREAAELRVKESDRIAAIVSQLTRLGARIEERHDGFVIYGPTPLCGAEVDAHRDHRLAMSLAVAGLVATGRTSIEGAESIPDSFPGFERQLDAIVGRSV